MAEILTIDLQGVPEAEQWTRDMKERADDFTPVWETAHRAFIREMLEQFATEGAYFGGEQWQPLSKRYEKWKKRHYPGQPILQRTGDTLMSLVNESDINHIAVITPHRAAFGTRVPYAVFHDKGKGVPKRQIIKTRDAFKRLVFRAAIAWVVAGKRFGDVETG